MVSVVVDGNVLKCDAEPCVSAILLSKLQLHRLVAGVTHLIGKANGHGLRACEPELEEA